jgi:hypothetical protein
MTSLVLGNEFVDVKFRLAPTSSLTLRELNIHSVILPCTRTLTDLGWKPPSIILSGGPCSIYNKVAPHAAPAFFEDVRWPTDGD